MPPFEQQCLAIWLCGAEACTAPEMPGTQEEAAERVDVAPRAAINRRTKDIGQPFGGKTSRRIRKMLSIS